MSTTQAMMPRGQIQDRCAEFNEFPVAVRDRVALCNALTGACCALEAAQRWARQRDGSLEELGLALALARLGIHRIAAEFAVSIEPGANRGQATATAPLPTLSPKGERA